MYEPDEDEKESLNDKILEMLGGEVDDFAGSQLPDEEKPAGGSPKGVEISITVTPHGDASAEKTDSDDDDDDGDEDKHDDIEHALGMHDGGCLY